MNIALSILKDNIQVRLIEKSKVEQIVFDKVKAYDNSVCFEENRLLNLTIEIKILQYALKVLLEKEIENLKTSKKNNHDNSNSTSFRDAH